MCVCAKATCYVFVTGTYCMSSLRMTCHMCLCRRVTFLVFVSQDDMM